MEGEQSGRTRCALSFWQARLLHPTKTLGLVTLIFFGMMKEEPCVWMEPYQSPLNPVLEATLLRHLCRNRVYRGWYICDRYYKVLHRD